MVVEYLNIKMRKFELTLIFLSIMSTTTAIPTVYMDTNCDDAKYASDSTALRMKLTRGTSYQSGMDCQLTIYAGFDSSEQMMIQFNDLSIEYTDGCTSDWLTIYNGDPGQDDVIGKRKFCGNSTPSAVYTSSVYIVTLYFKSDDKVQGSGFDIIITPYHTGNCDSWEYNCANGRCIDNSLNCNGHNPCGDNSDCSVSVGTIIGISIGSAVTAIVIVVVVACVVRRRRIVLVRAPVARATTTTIRTTTVQQHPPPYAQPAPVGYNQPLPQQYSPVAPQNVAYPPQPMTSYPPPAYPGQAPKY